MDEDSTFECVVYPNLPDTQVDVSDVPISHARQWVENKMLDGLPVLLDHQTELAVGHVKSAWMDNKDLKSHIHIDDTDKSGKIVKHMLRHKKLYTGVSLGHDYLPGSHTYRPREVTLCQDPMRALARVNASNDSGVILCNSGTQGTSISPLKATGEEKDTSLNAPEIPVMQATPAPSVGQTPKGDEQMGKETGQEQKHAPVGGYPAAAGLHLPPAAPYGYGYPPYPYPPYSHQIPPQQPAAPAAAPETSSGGARFTPEEFGRFLEIFNSFQQPRAPAPALAAPAPVAPVQPPVQNVPAPSAPAPAPEPVPLQSPEPAAVLPAETRRVAEKRDNEEKLVSAPKRTRAPEPERGDLAPLASSTQHDPDTIALAQEIMNIREKVGDETAEKLLKTLVSVKQHHMSQAVEGYKEYFDSLLASASDETKAYVERNPQDFPFNKAGAEKLKDFLQAKKAPSGLEQFYQSLLGQNAVQHQVIPINASKSSQPPREDPRPGYHLNSQKDLWNFLSH